MTKLINCGGGSAFLSPVNYEKGINLRDFMKVVKSRNVIANKKFSFVVVILTPINNIKRISFLVKGKLVTIIRFKYFAS